MFGPRSAKLKLRRQSLFFHLERGVALTGLLYHCLFLIELDLVAWEDPLRDLDDLVVDDCEGLGLLLD